MPAARSDVEASIERSGKWYAEAEMNMGVGAYNSTISSAYNAMFHAARAVLYASGYREKSHYCVARYLETFVERGMLEERWVQIFDRARNVRHADQYDTGFTSTREDAEAMMDMASRFIDAMKELLERI